MGPARHRPVTCDSGRPSSVIRFSTMLAMAASAAWPPDALSRFTPAVASRTSSPASACATISPHPSTPRWSFFHRRGPCLPCFAAAHSPSPRTARVSHPLAGPRLVRMPTNFGRDTSSCTSKGLSTSPGEYRRRPALSPAPLPHATSHRIRAPTPTIGPPGSAIVWVPLVTVSLGGRRARV